MSPHPDPLVEEFAQRRLKLETLFEEQSAVIRNEPGDYQAVYERNQHDFATQPGDSWVPVNDTDKEKNVKRMEEMCAMNPESIDDHMKIVFAVNGLLMYLMLDMNKLPTNTQLQIGKRTLELHREMLPPPTEPAQIELYESALKKEQELLTRPSGPSSTMREVTELDVESYKNNPFKVVGMSFIHLDRNEEVYYEVIEFGSSKKEMWYQIRFEGCVDCVRVEQKELLEMVGDSVRFVT